ncbi:MAG: cytochrome c1 [Alphaproteobacteria bacterium]|nr:cytochrome c1 [Alphaproteobacteria bacterium]
MNKKARILVAVAASLVAIPAIASTMSHALKPKEIQWSFKGALGRVDKQAAQRGFQVYKEVCSSCHSLKRVAFRNLADLGFSEDEVKTLAATYKVQDGPNDAGDMFDRPARPSDRIPEPFANEKAARAANGGAYPPDLSLMVKARHEGADYMYSLLTGFQQPPADMKMNTGMHYNPYFAGGQIAMPAPLAEGAVTYQDGTVASVDQMAQDVVNFLQWTAEPEMEHRKSLGLKVLLFMALFTIMFYVAKVRVWSKVK